MTGKYASSLYNLNKQRVKMRSMYLKKKKNTNQGYVYTYNSSSQ